MSRTQKTRDWPNRSCGIMARFMAASLLLWSCSAAAADEVRIVRVENVSTAFAGDEFRVAMRIVADQVPQGTLHWSHSASQRILSRGEAAVQPSGDAATAQIVLRTPELRDGVILNTKVTASFVPVGGEQVATLRYILWLFPRDPLAGQTQWAKQLNIELFDPEGTTAAAFEKLKLPYRALRQVAALNDPEPQGLLIIGEGTSLLRQRSLAETALHAAASGRRVLMLAPADGSIAVPATEGDGLAEGSLPGELRFSRQHIITELDKRLDARAWPNAQSIVPSSRLLVESHRGRVNATVSDQARAWPWLEVRFPDSKGVLVVCGFRVIKYWEHGPTPRFLLIRVLESLSPFKIDPLEN